MKPKPPADLRAEGAALWKAIIDSYEAWRPEELALIAEACRTADLLADLRKEGAGARLILLASGELRKHIGAIKWPTEDAEAPPQFSEWGRAMAAKRWKKGA